STAVIADMVKQTALKVDAAQDVHNFLTAHQEDFEFKTQPVAQYIAQNKLKVPDTVVSEVKKLQRVYQITTTDQAMSGLLKNGLHSAYQIIQYDPDFFAANFGKDLGGNEVASKIYKRAIQIHGAVLNVAISFLTASRSITLGTSPLPKLNSQPAAPQIAKTAAAPGAPAAPPPPPDGDGGQVLQPHPSPPSPAFADDIIAYPTLQSLFNSIDYCSCEDCRSILSPAAYLVDLLLYIDNAADGKDNAQAVLFDRRPDIQYLPLTCENTNTALPYIDIVNETLEYYIANTVQKLSLQNYKGHDTGEVATEDLMASPQYVMDTAYTALLNSYFPIGLPFHQPLEKLRRYFNNFSVPLSFSMEKLRLSDLLERPTPADYAWRDIFMEIVGMSRDEYRILTDSS
ncbi:MAG TPA: Tc toxin subunit A, partial [Puia sp.]|nr:Tc toxin subunit A [Puia sp.]